MDFNKLVIREQTNCTKWDLPRDPDVIPMWVADMDFLSATPIREALIERAQHNCYGYPYHQEEDLFKIISEWLHKRFFISIDPSCIFPIAGVVPSLFHCVETLTNIGDNIIIQSPVYPPFFSAVLNQSRNLLINSLQEKDGYYTIDFDDLEEKAQSASMFILCSPHNPIGRVWSKEELLKIGNICCKNSVIIVADEIHHDLVFIPHTPIFSLSKEISQQTITLLSPSKTFNTAGLFTSFISTENQRFRDQLYQSLKNKHAHHVNLFGIVATKAAYQYGEEWLTQLLPYLKENALYIHNYFKNNIPSISMTVPEGTYLGWIDFRNLNLKGQDLNDFLLHKAKLWLSNGIDFGIEGKGWARINYACPRSILEKAMLNLTKAIQEL